MVYARARYAPYVNNQAAWDAAVADGQTVPPDPPSGRRAAALTRWRGCAALR